MDSEVRQRWLNALRSGNYRQASGALRGTCGDRYCCLGVLLDVEGACEWWETSDGYYARFPDGRTSEQMPTNDFLKDVGLTVAAPTELNELVPSNPVTGGKDGCGQPAATALAKMNDRGMTFEQIADVIEKYL